MECHHFPETDWVLVYLWEVVHHSFCWWWILCVCECVCMYVFLSSSSPSLTKPLLSSPTGFLAFALLLLHCPSGERGDSGQVGVWCMTAYRTTTTSLLHPSNLPQSANHTLAHTTLSLFALIFEEEGKHMVRRVLQYI